MLRTAQQDAAHIKQLSKADMLDFYNQYISAASPTRAKIAAYLYAQSCTETKAKVAELLKGLDLEQEISAKIQDVLLQRERRQDREFLKSYLIKDVKLPEDRADAIIEAAKTLEAGLKVNGVANGEDGAAAATTREPVLITDVRAFKSTLVASSGARPVKDMSEYEEIDSKL